MRPVHYVTIVSVMKHLCRDSDGLASKPSDALGLMLSQHRVKMVRAKMENVARALHLPGADVLSR